MFQQPFLIWIKIHLFVDSASLWSTLKLATTWSKDTFSKMIRSAESHLSTPEYPVKATEKPICMMTLGMMNLILNVSQLAELSVDPWIFLVLLPSLSLQKNCPTPLNDLVFLRNAEHVIYFSFFLSHCRHQSHTWKCGSCFLHVFFSEWWQSFVQLPRLKQWQPLCVRGCAL